MSLEIVWVEMLTDSSLSPRRGRLPKALPRSREDAKQGTQRWGEEE